MLGPLPQRLDLDGAPYGNRTRVLALREEKSRSSVFAGISVSLVSRPFQAILVHKHSPRDITRNYPEWLDGHETRELTRVTPA
jgi:hypothetical protein